MSSGTKQCLMEGCTLISHSRRLCSRHYMEARHAGELEKYPRLEREMISGVRTPGDRVKNQAGYVSITLDDGSVVVEHRHVMEQVLRRPLVKGENVHHINGLRDDNRPENLELWVTVQPYGQRAKDVHCPHCDANWWSGARLPSNLAPLSATSEAADLLTGDDIAAYDISGEREQRDGGML